MDTSRRSFMGIVGGASISQFESIGSYLEQSKPVAETHFVETSLEFQILGDDIVPARREGPYRYNVNRGLGVLIALNRIETGNFRELVGNRATVFGHGSIQPMKASFAGSLDTLPSVRSDTPRHTRYIRLEGWDGSPSYEVRKQANESVIVDINGGSTNVATDSASRISLDSRTIPNRVIPGYDEPGGLEVRPRLEVRNYGMVEIHDARGKGWANHQ